MSLELLFDPLFRVPFATGLLLAALLPLIGMYLRLRNESRRLRRPMRQLAEAVVLAEDLHRQSAAQETGGAS